jgi:hypothetical protein
MAETQPMEEPVTFAPGACMRLKKDFWGVPAGTKAMLSGQVLTLDGERDKLMVVIDPGNPGSRDYQRLKVPRENLEWDPDCDHRHRP